MVATASASPRPATAQRIMVGSCQDRIASRSTHVTPRPPTLSAPTRCRPSSATVKPTRATPPPDATIQSPHGATPTPDDPLYSYFSPAPSMRPRTLWSVSGATRTSTSVGKSRRQEAHTFYDSRQTLERPQPRFERLVQGSTGRQRLNRQPPVDWNLCSSPVIASPRLASKFLAAPSLLSPAMIICQERSVITPSDSRRNSMRSCVQLKAEARVMKQGMCTALARSSKTEAPRLASYSSGSDGCQRHGCSTGFVGCYRTEGQVNGIALNPKIASVERKLKLIIDLREATVVMLRRLIPRVPSSEKEGAYLARQLLGHEAIVRAKRGRLICLLAFVRLCGLAIVRSVRRWRVAIRQAMPHLRSIPNDAIIFQWQNSSYFARMCTDLDFLPLPAVADPLLLNWFQRQLPWMLTQIPDFTMLPYYTEMIRLAFELETCASDGRAMAEVATAAASSLRLDSSSLEDVLTDIREPCDAATTKHAQEMIILEAQSTGLTWSLLELMHKARQRGRETGPWMVDGWLWSAYQVILYGDCLYEYLLSGLPACNHAFELDDAARVLQKCYRDGAIMRLRSAMKAAKVATQVAAESVLEEAAAVEMAKAAAMAATAAETVAKEAEVAAEAASSDEADSRAAEAAAASKIAKEAAVKAAAEQEIALELKLEATAAVTAAKDARETLSQLRATTVALWRAEAARQAARETALRQAAEERAARQAAHEAALKQADEERTAKKAAEAQAMYEFASEAAASAAAVDAANYEEETLQKQDPATVAVHESDRMSNGTEGTGQVFAAAEDAVSNQDQSATAASCGTLWERSMKSRVTTAARLISTLEATRVKDSHNEAPAGAATATDVGGNTALADDEIGGSAALRESANDGPAESSISTTMAEVAEQHRPDEILQSTESEAVEHAAPTDPSVQRDTSAGIATQLGASSDFQATPHLVTMDYECDVVSGEAQLFVFKSDLVLPLAPPENGVVEVALISARAPGASTTSARLPLSILQPAAPHGVMFADFDGEFEGEIDHARIGQTVWTIWRGKQGWTLGFLENGAFGSIPTSYIDWFDEHQEPSAPCDSSEVLEQRLLPLVAIAHFEAEGEGEMRTQAGDLVLSMKNDDSSSGWMEVSMLSSQETGFVPRDFLAKAPPHGVVAIAFEGQDAPEAKHAHLGQDLWITNLGRQGWVHAYLDDGTRGSVPISHIDWYDERLVQLLHSGLS